ncbi:MAG: transglutaminase domain-containing protein [Clostridiaceae bacterium]|nr:transglutaminase domain-containing protein [Clostridiaceae bacterium]
MKLNPITLLLIVAFLFPLVKGFLRKFSSKDSKTDLISTGFDIAFIIALFLGSYLARKVFVEHNEGIYKKMYSFLPENITSYIQNNNLTLYLIIIPIVIYIIYKCVTLIFYGICLVSVFPILDGIETKVRSRGNSFKRTLGVLFQLPRAFVYLLVISFVLNIFSMFYKDQEIDKYLQQSQLYNNICKEVVIPITKSTIAKKLPNIINNSFKIQIKNINQPNSIVYYNGVTIEEGVKSNSKIDNHAVKIISSPQNTYTTAKELYNWVGQNIDYDTEKANLILHNDFSKSSGAIEAFETKKGICFDYACLYVAMCRANNIKVRLITGDGFNGVSWVGHAWNQVYVAKENSWINVDTTFSKGGNYFDTQRFNVDHRTSEIAGEW